MHHDNFETHTTNGEVFVVVKNDTAISTAKLLARFSIITKRLFQVRDNLKFELSQTHDKYMRFRTNLCFAETCLGSNKNQLVCVSSVIGR